MRELDDTGPWLYDGDACATKPLELPIVAAGAIHRIGGGPRTELVSPATGTVVHVPSLTESIAAALVDADRKALVDVRLQDVIGLIDRVGRAWRNPEYTRRQVYLRHVQSYLGISERMAETEADWISVILSSHARLYDMVEVELGSRYVLDEWVPREEVRIRAFPRGLGIHVLPGNVPVSAALTLVRGLLSKNLTVLKVSSLDPVTPIALALSFHDIEPEHPVTRAISALYWAHDHEVGRHLLSQADVVCAWGGTEALEACRRDISAETQFIAFGPRRSLALVGADADPDAIASKLAHDIARYDQRACFSVREIFAEHAIVEPLCETLTAALEEIDGFLPRATASLDDRANVALSILEEEWAGARVFGPPDHRWTVIVSESPAVTDHPLSRTVWIRPVDDLFDSVASIDASVQTVVVAPWSRTTELRDALAVAGVDRIVDAGMVNILRPGAPHDGLDPLRQMVRTVAVENEAREHGKGMAVAIDQVEALRRGRITEFML